MIGVTGNGEASGDLEELRDVVASKNLSPLDYGQLASIYLTTHNQRQLT